MANQLVSAYRDALLTADTASIADWSSDEIHAVLTSASYTPSGTDNFFNDVPGGAVVADAIITGLSVTDGAVIAGTVVTFPTVTGSPATRLLLYKNTGTDSTSPILIIFDTFTAGMPITPDGSDIILSFNAAGIVQL